MADRRGCGRCVGWGGGLALLLLLPCGARAWQGGAPADSVRIGGTRATRFMVRGAVGGAALGGLGGAVLAGGLCDAADCSGTGLEGLFWGGLGGAVLGGIAGLVTGSAFRAVDGPEVLHRARSWSWVVTGGAAWAGAGELEGWGLAASASRARPTVTRVSFGFEALYLGRKTVRGETRLTNPAGTFVDRKRSVWHVVGVGMVARLDPEGGRPGPFLMASSGAYPLWESVEVDRFSSGGDIASGRVVDEQSWTLLPGVGVGGGYVWNRGGVRAAEVRARLHAILGAGDAAVLPVLELSAGARFQ